MKTNKLPLPLPTTRSVVPRLMVMAILALAVGCQQQSEDVLMTVGGKVVMDGEPVVRAQIQFFYSDGTAAWASTEDDGTFTLATGASQGAPLGPAVVVISKDQSPLQKGIDNLTAEDWEQINNRRTEKVWEKLVREVQQRTDGMNKSPEEFEAIMREEAKNLLPRKYARRETTPLSVKVTREHRDFLLELRSDADQDLPPEDHTFDPDEMKKIRAEQALKARARAAEAAELDALNATDSAPEAGSTLPKPGAAASRQLESPKPGEEPAVRDAQTKTQSELRARSSDKDAVPPEPQ